MIKITDKNLFLRPVLILLIFLSACTGSSSHNSAEVVSDLDFISTYVDKDLGATLSIKDQVSLYIPPGALKESQILSIALIKDKDSYTTYLDFQPRDIELLKPLSFRARLPLGLRKELLEAYVFSEKAEVIVGRDEAPIAKALPFSIEGRYLISDLDYFSEVVLFGSEVLNIVFQLPSQFLRAGDVEYNLSTENKWMTGHARMHLGFNIPNSPKEITNETGEQEFLDEEQKLAAEESMRELLPGDFPFKNTFIHASSSGQAAVYINNDTSFRNAREQWLYMGAKRRVNLLWQNEVDLSAYALEQEGMPYFPIGSEADAGFTSTSLIESIFSAIGFPLENYDNISELTLANDISARLGSPLPALQFNSKSLSDINEITVYENETNNLIIPIYAALRVKNNDQDKYEVEKVSASVEEGNEDLLDNFDEAAGELNLSFIYQKENNEPWEITFFIEKALLGNIYYEERKLTIHVGDERPVFIDYFTGNQLSEEWRVDDSESLGVTRNQGAALLTITTPVPALDCSRYFLWTPELTLNGAFSLKYRFIKAGYGRSALIVSSDGVKDGSANDNALEFSLSADADDPYLSVLNRVAGVDALEYQIDHDDYLNDVLELRIDRLDNEFHFYINAEKIPLVFSNAALNNINELQVGIETGACNTSEGNGVDILDLFSVSNGATLGFENMALSSSESFYGANHNLVCQDEFGSAWSMADWNQLDNYFEDEKDLDDLVEALGFEDIDLDERKEAWILRDGDANFDLIKDYFVAYHNHEKPDSFASYDDIDDNFFNLGAAFSPKYVLCTDL